MNQMTLIAAPHMAETEVMMEQAVQSAMGMLVAAWGQLAADMEQKIAQIRSAFGDVRTIGGRARPTMAKLVSELRAVVSQRDRRNQAALSEVCEIERAVQRLDRFRLLVLEGFHGFRDGGFECRDLKNMPVMVDLSELELRSAELETLRMRLRLV